MSTADMDTISPADERPAMAEAQGGDGAQTPAAAAPAASPDSSAAAAPAIWWTLPAYNESASIEDLIDRIVEVSTEQAWDYHIVIVDDGSHDGTGDLVRAKAEAGNLPIVLLRNEPNQGLGYTIRRGLRESSERAEPDDVIITLDADLTQDPIYAPSMVAKIVEGYDVAIASRYQKGSGVEGVPAHRVLLSYGASGMVALVRPVAGVRDYSCGFRAYRSSTIADGFAEYGDDFISERGFACMMEIAQRLRSSAAFVEVPFVLRYDEKRKESAIKIGPTIGAYGRVIMKVANTRRKPVPVATLAIAMTSVVISAIAQVLLRAGAKDLGGLSIVDTLSKAVTDWSAGGPAPWVVSGIVLYGIAAVLWLGVLSRMELAVAYPLGASGYVLVVLLAALSGEAVPPVRWFGVVLIVIGVLLVGWLGVAPVKKAVRR